MTKGEEEGVIDTWQEYDHATFALKPLEAKLFCKTCGSDDLEQLEWRKVNTGKFVESYDQESPHPYWCTVCEILNVEVLIAKESNVLP